MINKPKPIVRVSIVAVIVTLIMILTFNANAVNDIDLRVGDKLYGYSVGSIVQCTCYLKTSEPIVNGEFKVKYTPNLKVEKISTNNVTGAMSNDAKSINTVLMNFTNANQEADFTSLKDIMLIQFKVLESGSGSLDFEVDTINNKKLKDVEVLESKIIVDTSNASYQKDYSEVVTTPTTIPTEPTTVKVEPTTAVEPTTEKVTDKTTEPATQAPTVAPVATTNVVTPTEVPSSSVAPAVTEPVVKPTESVEPVEPVDKHNKKVNTLKVVNKKTKVVKAKKLKYKGKKITPLKITKAQGKVTVTKIKKGTSKKLYKKIKVYKKSGKIYIKKGKYAKKTYKIKLKVTASGNTKYLSKTIIKTVKIKIK